ncbi:DUF4328 domain-containing protein [Isoptericola halotolerans]|uniref:DUF4328 domain-containing protein n=1 Tax=Isoptericola halotolerans TaxID=300560 RepID=UPI00388FBE45
MGRPAVPAYGAYAPEPAAYPGQTAGEPWLAPAPVPAAPTGLAAWTIGLACAWTALQALVLVLSPAAAEEYARALGAGGSSMDVFTAYDEIGLLLLPVQVAVFVVGCLWLQRSRAIAVAGSPHVRQVRGAVWVWLGWVVPVVSLWFPFQVVRDVRAGTVGTRRAGGLGLWWACWLVSLWAANQSGLVAMGMGSWDPASLPFLEGVGTLACAVGLVLWIGVVREISAAQVSAATGG